MNSTVRILLALSLGLAGTVQATDAAATTPLNLPVGGQGVLQLAFPSDWKAQVFGPMDAPTVRWSAPEGTATFLFGVTVMPMPGDAAPTDEHLRALIQKSGDDLLATAQQKEIVLEALTGENAHGYLFHLTDRKPEKGDDDFREMHKGMVEVEPLMLSVTLLTHSGDASTLERARAVLAGARFAPMASQPPGD